MDIIYISELKVDANLGVCDWEKHLSQVVEISLDIANPEKGAEKTDDIADTIDYAVVSGRIRKELIERRFELLETMAEFIADLLLNDFRSPWVRVNIAKVGMIRDAKKVGVIIERPRNSGLR